MEDADSLFEDSCSLTPMHNKYHIQPGVMSMSPPPSLYHSAGDLNGDTKRKTSDSQDEVFELQSENVYNDLGSPCAKKSSLLFCDGRRSVDFVLVWDDLKAQSVTEVSYEKRKVFEANLIREGLDLEYEKRQVNGLNFIKIHAPLEVLRRYSEILKLRMPMRELQALGDWAFCLHECWMSMHLLTIKHLYSRMQPCYVYATHHKAGPVSCNCKCSTGLLISSFVSTVRNSRAYLICSNPPPY